MSFPFGILFSKNHMYTLFDQDDQHPGIRLVDVLDDSGSQQPKKRIAIIYDYDRMEDYLGEWKLRKEQLANGEITQEEYTEWRLNWPATADACYPETYHRKWRKEK